MTDFARKFLVISLVGVAAVLTGCGGGGGGGSSDDAATDLIVQQVLPTNGQEVNSGLTDPGINGVITTKFSERLMPSSVLDPNNAFNGLNNWNAEATKMNWLNEIIFLGLYIIPVYGIVWLGDVVIFNTIDYWGKNPIGPAGPFPDAFSNNPGEPEAE